MIIRRVSPSSLELHLVLLRSVSLTIGIAATYVLLWHVHKLTSGTPLYVSDGIFISGLSLLGVGIPLACALSATFFLLLRLRRMTVGLGDIVLLGSVVLVVLLQFSEVFTIFLEQRRTGILLLGFVTAAIVSAYALERIRLFPTPWVKISVMYGFVIPLLLNVVGLSVLWMLT